MKKQKILLILAVFALIFGLYPQSPVLSMEYNQNLVLSDWEMTDYSSMSLTEIQKFLESKNSFLSNFVTTDDQGNKLTAAQVIFQSARNYQINPKVILVKLQKEQSLIENNSPTTKQLDWAMGYAICDSCSMDDPALQKFRGFFHQVDQATQRLRWYLDNPQAFKQAGVPYLINGQIVIPANQATAALYIYTPHIHGNYLFWKIWNKWFLQFYPDGSLLRSLETGKIYLIKFGEKRPFANMSALISRYDPGRVLTVTEKELDKYETGSIIQFANYSLLREPSGKIYLLVDDQLKHIDSYETFRYLGFNPQEVTEVNETDLIDYETGEAITLKSAYPRGALLQNNLTGGVYFVQNGVKHALIAREIMQINYPKYPIRSVSPDELDVYEDGPSIKFREGELLKSVASPKVYLISEGKKCLIADEKVFLSLGFKWNDIKAVSEQALSNLTEGQIIDLSFKQ